MSETLLKQFSIQLRHHREACGYSQQDVADLLHVGNRTYQRIESGETSPSLNLVFQLARILHFKIQEIFSPKETMIDNGSFKFYSKAEEERFEKDELVVNSKLLDIVELKKTLTLEEIKNHPMFLKSPFYLAISTPKIVIVNPSLSARLGCKSEVNAYTLVKEIRSRGALWAFLLANDTKYIEERVNYNVSAGHIEILAKRVFVKEGENLYLFGAAQIIGDK
jgi:DNA-binding XRE family transcriptional regulator